MPDEPLDPDVPEDPDEPLVPEEPDDPEVPLEPATPAAASEADTSVNPGIANTPPIVVCEPLTVIASSLNEPIFTVSFENTSKIGKPEISDTANKDPDKESVIENNCPWDPTTSNIVDPELSRVNLEAVTLFSEALLPDVITFFQFGIF